MNLPPGARRAMPAPARPSPRGDGFVRGLGIGLGVAFGLLAASGPIARLRRSWGHRAAIDGWSMFPLLHPGDWVLIDPWAYGARDPRAGELVVAPDPREPGRWLVKRVRAVAPDGRLELAGDDPARSTDSRTFGAVEVATVVGRPWLRYWPPRRIGRLA